MSAFSTIATALFLGAGIFIYGSLIRQIAVRPAVVDAELRGFRVGDAVLALLLVCWFGLNISAALNHRVVTLQTRDLIAQGLITIGFVLFVVAFLWIRGVDVHSLGGFSRLGLWRIVVTSGVLLFAAYPLLFVGEAFTEHVLRVHAERQPIVELFAASTTIEQRLMVIVLAIVLAPIAEEFVFRFFLYGVIKRYFGRLAGLIGNAGLFAAVHTHLPSFVPLFLLGSCLTIAYEWSGSILVSMSMHALFNTATLVALAFPELVQQ